MRSGPAACAARFLPRGWLDLLRQLGLFAAAYMLYRLVRGLVDGRAGDAFANARELIALERSLNLFVEPALHAWTSSQAWLMGAVSWTYVNAHFAGTFGILAFIYLRRNASFYFVRNMFLVAMGIALVGYALYPTAPPRFMREWGFSDPVAELTGATAATGSTTVLYNPFAAVPSMHVAFAIMVSLAMARMTRRPWVKALWWAYPVAVTFVVVATANHWWVDAFLGALTAVVAAACAQGVFARWRPTAWAWHPAPGTAA